MNRVQKRLQDPKINFREAAADMNSLEQHFTENREKLCEDQFAKEKEVGLIGDSQFRKE